MLPKLLVIGHARHGKDTFCEIARDLYNFSFESSSKFCSKLFIFNALKDKYDYKSEEECYLDRLNHRTEWFDLITAYNTPNSARLGLELLQEYDIYCGLRNYKEFNALKNANVYDYAIWVDRSEHLPLESKKSMTLEPWMADFIIDNNSTIDQFKFNINMLMTKLLS